MLTTEENYWENILNEEGLGNIDIRDGFITEENFNWDELCDGDCNTCMTTSIDDYKTKLGAVLCCKSHPETGDVNSETGACPEYDMNSGKCRIYESEDYPDACSNYHCKTHNR